MVTNNDTVALAAAATVAAVAAGYGIHRANATRGRGGSSAVATTVLVFRDRCDEGSGADVDGGGGLSPNAMAFKCHPSPPRSPATGGLSQDLRAAAARDLGDGASSADGVRLFLHSTGVEVDAYSDDATVLRLLREESSTNGLSVPVLICTFEGKELSKKASNLTLEKFPRPTSGIDLPFGLGYVRSFTKGKREIPGFNGYENLLRENQSSVKTVRIRRFPYRVDDRLNQEHYGIDYKPQEDEGLVLTVDPRMVSEMLHRQRDFPKMWSSAQERGVKEFVESGLDRS